MSLAKKPTDTAPQSQHHFRTVQEARALARDLAAICPRPHAVETGLFELFMNAIEHGNLEIGSTEKGILLSQDSLEEEINARLLDPAYRDRRVEVTTTIAEGCISFHIHDEGPGFNWRLYLKHEAEKLDRPYGRGILIARKLAFDELRYSEEGNSVVASVNMDN
ncbi:ATP-binding protein [Kordiimonas gwangyangensis]|uniref:ATP-binding protein n=1 Tax=Kordiimonas gwangyangensis TaxID=288022 RepID=UPI00037DE937|nr:ATP-binding protein [Kordiimonas gwangyangensis]